MKDEVEKISKEAAAALIRHSLEIYLEGLSKTKKYLSQESNFHSRVSI
jgi:hypothetical protein